MCVSLKNEGAVIAFLVGLITLAVFVLSEEFLLNFRPRLYWRS